MTTPRPANPFPGPADDPAPQASLLIDLVEQQRELYGELLGLSEEQTTFIEQEQTERLLAVLSRRQQLVDRLGRINGELRPFREAWPRFVESVAPDSRQRLAGLLDEVEQMMSRILAADERDRQRLAEAHRKIGGELTNVGRAGAANAAYRARAAKPAARFTDNQG